MYTKCVQSKFSKISTSRKVYTFRDGSPWVNHHPPNGGGWRGTKQQIIRGEMNHVQLNFLLFFTILQMCEKRHFSCFSCFHEFVKNTQIQRICKSRILPNGEERMLVKFCAKSQSRLQKWPGTDDSHLHHRSEL